VAKARATISTLEIELERLDTARQRLRARHVEALADEDQAAWLPRYEAARSKQQELAKELAETYPALTAKLTELLGRIEATDNEARAVDAAKPRDSRGSPIGDGRHFVSVEPLVQDNPGVLVPLMTLAFRQAAQQRKSTRCSP
jgi:hypothetical protein